VTVADATPLIALARIQRLECLRELYDQVLIGSVVKAETIDAGRSVRAHGVEQIEAAVDAGWLTIASSTEAESDLAQRLTQRSRLHRAEAESIALARVRKLRLVVDDKEARSVAGTVGVQPVGTAFLLLEAHRRRGLGPDALEKTLRDLGRILWLSPSVVAEVLRRARQAQR
jgi:predicted nucleic acid-binding protein